MEPGRISQRASEGSDAARAVPWRPNVPREIHELLKHGEITRCEHIPWGSNYTFCASLQFNGREARGVYKPRRGERPLWDFPDGTLYRREYAAFLTSQALGWPFIPPTVIRAGPYGVGSMQLFVESEPPRSMRELQDANDLNLARIAAFDFITNNADRKAGHVLRAADGKLWGIDHGLCFNAEPKVRTVLLHFCGQPVPRAIMAELGALVADRARLDNLTAVLRALIACDEVDIFLQRLEWMLQRGVFPSLSPYRNVPWPPF
jgi:uncharacterized repeat protein (TIGR03843 family)